MWLPAMCYMYSMGVITAVCLVYEISCGHKSSPQLTHVTCTFACLPSFLFNMSIDRSTTPCHWWHPRPFRNHHCPSFPSHLHWITSPSSPSPLCSSTIKEEICLTTDKWAPQFKEGQKRRRKEEHLCGVCVCVCVCVYMSCVSLSPSSYNNSDCHSRRNMRPSKFERSELLTSTVVKVNIHVPRQVQ